MIRALKNLLSFGSAIAALVFIACGKPSDSSTPSAQQAVARVEQAYAGADPATKATIATMADAMKKGDYEQAVVSLTTIRSAQAKTPEQQEAIVQSAQAIEAKLLRAMEAGDKNAERAYQLMKELKRN